jgi:hypothetical protein
MSTTVTDIIQNIKTTVDNDSLMFVFPDDAIAEAFDRTKLYEQWSTDLTKPTTTTNFGCILANTNDIYCISGYTTNGATGAVEVYDALNRAWNTTSANKPTACQSFGCVFIGTKIYCIGGATTSSNLNVVEIYDIVGNIWTTGTVKPTAAKAFGCVAIGTLIYCIGGYTGSYSNIVEIYDTTSNTWSTGTNKPTASSNFGCVAIGTLIYCIGGYSSSSIVSTVEIYNTVAGTWSTGTAKTTAAINFGCVVYNSYIYCIGGYNAGALSVVEVYNTTTSTWFTDSSKSTASYGFGCVVYNSKVYCIDGYSSALSSAIEIFYLSLNTWNTNLLNSYYDKCIMPRLVRENCLNVYYKNTNGNWINYTKYCNSFPTEAILTGAVTHEETMKISTTLLPRCRFMDSNRYTYIIDEYDGNTVATSLPYIFIDETKTSNVSIEQCSIDDLTIPFSARHVMQDLVVTTPNNAINTLLVWLNGVFVPIIAVGTTSPHSFYIRNAMTILNTVSRNQQSGAAVTFSSTGTYKTATVSENTDNDIYRYDFNIRLFSWNNVVVGDWLSPTTITTTPIVNDYAALYIPYTLTFDVDVNANAHMLFENGALLDPSEYTISSSNSKQIILKNAAQHAYNMLHEAIADVADNPTVYSTTTPLKLIRAQVLEKTYGLVNFSTTDTTKTLYMRHSQACAVNFPYKNEITFSNISIGDLITIDGAFTPYEYVHAHTIRYPTKTFTYNDSDIKIYNTDVSRISFYLQ